MGRNRESDEAEVLARCAEALLRTGYEGTSVDDLVQASGLHRGSLYQAFGSKRGLFIESLRRHAASNTQQGLDLLLIALLELAPRDEEVRKLCADRIDPDEPRRLGARLIQRAGLGPAASSEGDKV